MKQTASIRALAAWLCTLMLVPSAVSCADNSNTPAQTTAAPSETTAAPVTDPEDANAAALQEAIAAIPKKDYGGDDFVILCRDEQQDANWVAIDIYSEEETGDAINDAVYQRNRILEENLNIKIKSQPVKNPDADAKKQIPAGDSSFDMMTTGLSFLSSMAPSGYLVDLKTVPGLELDNPWWDQYMNSGLTIKDKLFFSTGDISIMDNYGTWCIMFNKKIANDYDIENLYDLTRDGKWTLDKMYSIAKTTAKDLDGNGTMDPEDQWGFLTEDYNEYGLWAASGETIIQKDADDLPVLSAYNDRSVQVIDAVSALQHDTACTLSSAKVGGGCAYLNEAFGNGRAMFIYGGMWLISKYRGYDIDFGILPAPKYDENQERYYNTYSYSNCTAYAIPTTNTDLERAGIITEAMAEISRYTLTPAYYDISLKGKFIRDEESADMLDIVLAQRAYDLGNIFNWGNMFSMIMSLGSNTKGDFSSMYAKKEKGTLKAIDKFIASLDQME